MLLIYKELNITYQCIYYANTIQIITEQNQG